MCARNTRQRSTTAPRATGRRRAQSGRRLDGRRRSMDRGTSVRARTLRLPSGSFVTMLLTRRIDGTSNRQSRLCPPTTSRLPSASRSAAAGRGQWVSWNRLDVCRALFEEHGADTSAPRIDEKKLMLRADDDRAVVVDVERGGVRAVRAREDSGRGSILVRGQRGPHALEGRSGAVVVTGEVLPPARLNRGRERLPLRRRQLGSGRAAPASGTAGAPAGARARGDSAASWSHAVSHAKIPAMIRTRPRRTPAS